MPDSLSSSENVEIVVKEQSPDDFMHVLWDSQPNDNEVPKKKSWLDEAAMMFLAEMSMETIATKLNKPFETIAYLPRLPEFKAKLAALCEDTDTGAAEKLIRGAMVDNVLTLIGLRDDRGQKGEVRYKAATYLLDRQLGRVPDAGKAPKDQTPAEKLLAEILSNLPPDKAIDKQIEGILQLHPELRVQFGLR